MKIFTFLFSIYLVALSVLPCSDAFPDRQNDNDKFSFTTSHDHEDKTSDFCSPFCICNCCSTPVIAKFKASISPISKTVAVSQQKFPLRELSFISKYTGTVWHPPQIIA